MWPEIVHSANTQYEFSKKSQSFRKNKTTLTPSRSWPRSNSTRDKYFIILRHIRRVRIWIHNGNFPITVQSHGEPGPPAASDPFILILRRLPRRVPALSARNLNVWCLLPPTLNRTLRPNLRHAGGANRVNRKKKKIWVVPVQLTWINYRWQN